MGNVGNLLLYNDCSTIIHALIRSYYFDSILYNGHKYNTIDRPNTSVSVNRNEHITSAVKNLHWIKIPDRITYTMLTYKSYTKLRRLIYVH